MTTPDIAGLCERLKTLWLELSDAHAEPPATARIMNALHQSGNTLERQAAEIERLRGALEANKKDAFPLVKQCEDRVWRVAQRIIDRSSAALTGEDA